MLLKEDERLAVLLIFLAVALSDFAASFGSAFLVGISVAFGSFSFVKSLAMVLRIQGVKVDRLVKMPANSMFNAHIETPCKSNDKHLTLIFKPAL